MNKCVREIPASVGQRLLWYLDAYRGQDGALNCPVLCKLAGPLDVTILKDTLADLAARHESLRTTFVRSGRNINQIIHEPRPVVLHQMDLSGAADPQVALENEITVELQTRVDPAIWPVRATVYRVRDNEHVFCINTHHLVTDAWSCGVIFRDFRLLFERRAGIKNDLPEPACQYREFMQKQQEFMEGKRSREHQNYWRRQLHDAKLPPLPLDHVASNTSARHSARETAEIKPKLTESLRHLAQSRKTTLFNVMLSIYYSLLHRMTGQADLTVASLFANRATPELQQIVGFLANMVLLRSRLGRATTFADVLSQTHRTVMDAISHDGIPYYVLPLESIRQGPRRPDDVVFQMMPETAYRSRMAGLEVEVLIPEGVGTRFELELALVPQRGGFRAILFYNSRRLDHRWARQLISAYSIIATAVAANYNIKLAELPLELDLSQGQLK